MGFNNYFSKHGTPLFLRDFNLLYSIIPVLWRIRSIANKEDKRTTTVQELGHKNKKNIRK